MARDLFRKRDRHAAARDDGRVCNHECVRAGLKPAATEGKENGMTNALLLLTLCTSLVVGQVDVPAAGLEHAKTFASIGDWENGIKFLEPHILQNPEDAEARLLLAECYYNWQDRRSTGDSSVDMNRKRGEAQIRILGRLGDAGFKMLLKGLHSETRYVSTSCAEVLGEKQDRRALDDLIRVLKEEPDRTENAMDALVRIERGRKDVDDRVVSLLTTVLEDSKSSSALRRTAAFGIATLDVPVPLALLKKELGRVIDEGTEPTRHPRIPRPPHTRYDTEEAVYLVDAIVRRSAGKVDESVAGMLEGMSSLGFFFHAERRVGDLSSETLVYLCRAALGMIGTDQARVAPGSRGGSQPAGFLLGLAGSFPDVFLDGETKKLLHDHCDSPNRDVRIFAIEIVEKIRDEDALPILLPKLRPSLLPEGQSGWFLSFYQGKVTHATGRFAFAWLNDEPFEIVDAVKKIGSPRTTAFLLEKLRSEDMAWVVAAAMLLADIGEGSAVGPLKERYSAIAATEDQANKEARKAISGAYEVLSGRPITEPEQE
jgi:HEAT repeat protein